MYVLVGREGVGVDISAVPLAGEGSLWPTAGRPSLGFAAGASARLHRRHHQTQALGQKNMILLWRHKRATFLQVLSPIMFLLFILAFRTMMVCHCSLVLLRACVHENF